MKGHNTVAVEEIIVNGSKVVTLKELLRPGLKAVFIGLNPSPVSVRSGHYYQGRHGRTLWDRLRKYRITGPLPSGVEDDAAFAQGYGFADMVRRPTASSKELTRKEKSAAVMDLVVRLSKIGDCPLVVFTYTEPYTLAKDHLKQAGYCVFRMPSPYAPKALADAMIAEIKEAL